MANNYLTSQARRSSSPNLENLIESVNAKKELATKADISHDTIAKHMRVIGRGGSVSPNLVKPGMHE